MFTLTLIQSVGPFHNQYNQVLYMLAEWSKEVLPKSCYISLYLYQKSRQNTQQMRVKIPTINEAISIISIPLSDHIELIYAIKIQQKLLKWFKDVFLSFENSIRGYGARSLFRTTRQQTWCVYTLPGIYIFCQYWFFTNFWEFTSNKNMYCIQRRGYKVRTLGLPV